MRKVPTSILLTQKTFETLNTFSNLTKLSKSRIIEEALERYFEDLDIKVAEQRAMTSTKEDFVSHEEVGKSLKNGNSLAQRSRKRT